MAETTTSTGNRKQATPQDEDNLVVVDIGKKQRRKRIRQLRKGRGRLMERIQDTVAAMKEDGAIAANAQPVVIVVREKRRGFGKKGFGRW